MKRIFQIVSALGLLLTVVPSFFVFYQKITWQTHARLMVLGAVLWFSTSFFWIRTKIK